MIDWIVFIMIVMGILMSVDVVDWLCDWVEGLFK